MVEISFVNCPPITGLYCLDFFQQDLDLVQCNQLNICKADDCLVQITIFPLILTGWVIAC